MSDRKYALTVNGTEYHVVAAADCPLLYVLRNEIGLSGPRFGCGAGDCGACSVLIDGEDVRSCQMAVSEVAAEVTTLEGLPALVGLPEGELHPVQQAWIDEQVPQCGYCQSGMMIAAVALLNREPDPTVAQIRDAYSYPRPHLCRCGTYTAIICAVRRASAAMSG
jgi:aerobic-type carbon monoxide dehydrogenase small subunit (CoxS/CutS family)